MDFKCEVGYFDEEVRIERAELYHFKPIPMYHPFGDSTMITYNSLVKGMCWLALYDESGHVGMTRCSATVATKVLPLVLSGKRERYGDVYQRIFWTNRNDGYSSPSFGALGQLDCAMLDLFSKRRGLPIHRYLGATRDWLNTYASGHGTHATIDEMVEEIEEWKRLGYNFYKIKVGTEFGTKQEWDVERVKLMRELVGPEARIAIDANQLWDAREAMRFLEKVLPYGIYWYEEPVHSHDLIELEKLCKISPVPISMGESLRNSCFFKAYADAGVGAFQANPPHWGFWDWVKVRDMAKERGIIFSANTGSLSWLPTADEDCYMEYLRPLHRPVYDLLAVRPDEHDGKLFLSTAPGSSIVPDWDLVRRRDLLDGVEEFYPDENDVAPND